MLGEFANAQKATPTVHINHEVLMAILRPQLSAKYGMAKNPTKLPAKIIEVSTVVIPLISQIR